jgi:hypothetical protein
MFNFLKKPEGKKVDAKILLEMQSIAIAKTAIESDIKHLRTMYDRINEFVEENQAQYEINKRMLNLYAMPEFPKHLTDSKDIEAIEDKKEQIMLFEGKLKMLDELKKLLDALKKRIEELEGKNG